MTTTADDPLEVFRRELVFVCRLVGIGEQWAWDADDGLLWELRRRLSQ